METTKDNGYILSEKERQALEFARRYRGWNTYAEDKETKAIMKNLEQTGLIELNEFSQFKYIGGK